MTVSEASLTDINILGLMMEASKTQEVAKTKAFINVGIAIALASVVPTAGG